MQNGTTESAEGAKDVLALAAERLFADHFHERITQVIDNLASEMDACQRKELAKSLIIVAESWVGTATDFLLDLVGLLHKR